MGRWLLCLTLLLGLSTPCSAEQLVFVIDIIRHGDRTPVASIPGLEKWPEGLGQLTAKGRQQEYELGKKLRERYIQKAQLLPDHYQVESLYVRSTQFNRTRMSARSLLSGLYPVQSIPIHPHPVILRTAKDLQRTYPSLFRKIYSSPTWQQKTKELQPKFAAWSRIAGKPITHLQQLIEPADTLYVAKQHHIPLPAGVSTAEADQIIAAGHWAFVMKYQEKSLGKIAGQDLLAMIGGYIKQALKPSPLKAVIFLSHDSTQLLLMSALGAPFSEVPGYASDLNISLYQDKQHYFVKLRHNDKALSIPSCAAKTSCSLAEFQQLIQQPQPA